MKCGFFISYNQLSVSCYDNVVCFDDGILLSHDLCAFVLPWLPPPTYNEITCMYINIKTWRHGHNLHIQVMSDGDPHFKNFLLFFCSRNINSFMSCHSGQCLRSIIVLVTRSLLK